MTKRPIWITTCTAVALAAGSATAQTQASAGESPSLSNNSNSPLIAIENPDLVHGVELMLDLNRFDQLLDAEEVTLTGVPVDQGVTLDLELERFEVLSPDVQVMVWDGDAQTQIAPPDTVLLRGHVAGDPDSTAFIALSEVGTNGYIETADTTWIISNGQFGTDDPLMSYNLTTLPEGAMNILEFVCRTGELDHPVKPKLGGNAGSGNSTRMTTCDVIELAIDTDFQFTNNTFGGSQAAATAYIETLIGATNTIYKRDVNAVFEISFIRLWSTNSDPYTGDVTSYLFELQSQFTGPLSGVQRDLAHVLSPTNGGGGVAWVDVICNSNFGYSASANLNGFFPQPLGQSSQNWDIVVVPHELGHNCGTGHTHDSYNPPIDNCGNGNCAGASNGTLMSYCHLCSPGIWNINLEFHPTVQLVMEAAIGSAGCVGTAGTPSFSTQPSSQTVCVGDPVTFVSNATDPGNISYQWFFNGSEIVGATSSSYSIASVSAGDFGDYSVEASTVCDTATSTTATLTECSTTGCSPADVTTTGAGAGDPGFGVPDGAVTTTDLNFFVNAWVANDASIADVTTTGAGAGDPGFGVPDGNVTSTDLNYFVNIWLQGCP